MNAQRLRRPPLRLDLAGVDEDARRDVEHFLHARGSGLRAPYAASCIVERLETARERGAVSPADVRVLYPGGPGVVAGPPHDAASQLRRASDGGLVAAPERGRYRLTSLGHAVVGALPHGARAGAPIGRRPVSCTSPVARTWRRT